MDVFAGRIELTALERAFVHHLLQEWYMSGDDEFPHVGDRGAFVRDVSAKFATLKLERMVTPDGSRLVSVAEHDAVVNAAPEPRRANRSRAETGGLTTVAMPAEVRLADLVHALASTIPSGPALRHPVHGEEVYVSAIWDAILADRGSLLWHAFACPGSSLLGHDDGGYGFKAWLHRAVGLRDDRGAPLVLLADGTGDERMDPTAARRSQFVAAIGADHRVEVTFHFLTDRAIAPDAYLPVRPFPAHGRAIFAPPAMTTARAASEEGEKP